MNKSEVLGLSSWMASFIELGKMEEVEERASGFKDVGGVISQHLFGDAKLYNPGAISNS